MDHSSDARVRDFEEDLDDEIHLDNASINNDTVLSLPAAHKHLSSAPPRRSRDRKGCYSERFPDRRVIFLLTVMQLMGFTFLFLAGLVESVAITLVWGFLSLGLYLFIRWANHRGYNDTLSAAVARGLLMGALALAILFYYEGTHGTVHEMREREPNLKLYDDELLSMDRFMLGWLFPDGQLSLWADENRFIGPESLIGPLLTEILQIYYARYRPRTGACYAARNTSTLTSPSCSFFGWCSVLIVYVGLWEYFICGFTGARTDSLEAYAAYYRQCHHLYHHAPRTLLLARALFSLWVGRVDRHTRLPTPVSSCRDVEAHNPHKYTEMQEMGSAEDGDEKDSPSFDGYGSASRARPLSLSLWPGILTGSLCVACVGLRRGPKDSPRPTAIGSGSGPSGSPTTRPSGGGS